MSELAHRHRDFGDPAVESTWCAFPTLVSAAGRVRDEARTTQIPHTDGARPAATHRTERPERSR
ncbi:hypothetical protein OHA40_29540 [Nocardia sp. NBC_00508]|uniref:hypothetical protein n=1 Tax=Nocardia sp. NBC_00508 TaxID=2975992 RepID=UPI002E80C826|nr:hypothetical protein [Nocardia sp. NBC_00508]WUD65713.1 hypothetical protein OHA40_29540 [Nocardia sp. NBC_00508]